MPMGFKPLADPAGRKWQGQAEQHKANRDLILDRPQPTAPIPEKKKPGRFKQLLTNMSRGSGPSLMKKKNAGAGGFRSLYR